MPNHSVAIVVDREFGERLLPLTQRLHVWICHTPINREAAEKSWAAAPAGAVSNEVGATTFGVDENDSPEDMAINRLADIDLHHFGWSRMEFYGVELSDKLRLELQEYGVNEFQETFDGFVCSRPAEEEKNATFH